EKNKLFTELSEKKNQLIEWQITVNEGDKTLVPKLSKNLDLEIDINRINNEIEDAHKTLNKNKQCQQTINILNDSIASFNNLLKTSPTEAGRQRLRESIKAYETDKATKASEIKKLPDDFISNLEKDMRLKWSELRLGQNEMSELSNK